MILLNHQNYYIKHLNIDDKSFVHFNNQFNELYNYFDDLNKIILGFVSKILNSSKLFFLCSL